MGEIEAVQAFIRNTKEVLLEMVILIREPKEIEKNLRPIIDYFGYK
jgi:hypothetical protein